MGALMSLMFINIYELGIRGIGDYIQLYNTQLPMKNPDKQTKDTMNILKTSYNEYMKDRNGEFKNLFDQAIASMDTGGEFKPNISENDGKRLEAVVGRMSNMYKLTMDTYSKHLRHLNETSVISKQIKYHDNMTMKMVQAEAADDIKEAEGCCTNYRLATVLLVLLILFGIFIPSLFMKKEKITDE